MPVGLGRPDPGDAEQLGGRGRPDGHQVGQCGVSEHHVSGNVGRLGGRRPVLAQSVHYGVVGEVGPTGPLANLGHPAHPLGPADRTVQPGDGRLHVL